MKFRSFYPPVSYKGDVSGKWYVICSSDGDGWVEVGRPYTWAELKEMWQKIEYTKKLKVSISKVKKAEYKVKGSKGKIYNVTNDGGYWSCSCPAYGFGRGKECKHIVSLRN
jgi:hypothetical protein